MKKRQAIPEYTQEEREEALWDTPLTNPGAWEEVEWPYQGPPAVYLSLRLPDDALKALRQKARERGIGHTELARMLIIEGLRRSEEEKARVEVLEKRVERLEAALREGRGQYRAVAPRKTAARKRGEGSDS